MPELNPRDNHSLDALPDEERERLFPHLSFVSMPLGKVLYESGESLKHIYFPTDSIVSLLYVMKDGASAEIAVVGNEGAIGVAYSWVEKRPRAEPSCRAPDRLIAWRGSGSKWSSTDMANCCTCCCAIRSL